jgi:hypothetical protein
MVAMQVKRRQEEHTYAHDEVKQNHENRRCHENERDFRKSQRSAIADESYMRGSLMLIKHVPLNLENASTPNLEHSHEKDDSNKEELIQSSCRIWSSEPSGRRTQCSKQNGDDNRDQKTDNVIAWRPEVNRHSSGTLPHLEYSSM